MGINETSHINASLNILVNHMVNAATDPVKWLDPAALRSPCPLCCPVSGAGCTHCYLADYYVAAARRWDDNLVSRDSNMFRKYVQCSYFYKGVSVGTWAQPLIKKSDIEGKKGVIQA